jgi:hemolysin D
MAQELARVTSAKVPAIRDEAMAGRALLEFQSPTSALVAKEAPAVARYATYVLASMLAAFLVVAGTVPVDRVVTATGRVAPQGNDMLVQPLETSVVRSIDVRVGQRVRKGDLLARLDPTFSGADMTSLDEQTQSLQAEVDRLTAEADGGEYYGSLTPSGMLQGAIFKQRQAERGFKLENFHQKISSLTSALDKAKSDIASYNEQLRIASDMLAARQRLEREGVGSKFNTQQALSTVTDQRRSLNAATATATAAQRDIDAQIAERDGYVQQYRADISQQLTDANRKLFDARDQFAKARRRHDLVDLRAESDATVLAIAKVSVGSVLNAAEPFLTLVPDDATMEIDAAIPSADVGFVRVDDPVVVKFDAYRFFEHGYAEGHVRVVAPDSQATPTDGPDKPKIDSVPLGASLYRVKIAIDRMKMTNLPADFRLQPGLGIEADIKVGRRTILNYMLGRFIPALTEGMREP